MYIYQITICVYIYICVYMYVYVMCRYKISFRGLRDIASQHAQKLTRVEAACCPLRWNWTFSTQKRPHRHRLNDPTNHEFLISLVHVYMYFIHTYMYICRYFYADTHFRSFICFWGLRTITSLRLCGPGSRSHEAGSREKAGSQARPNEGRGRAPSCHVTRHDAVGQEFKWADARMGPKPP